MWTFRISPGVLHRLIRFERFTARLRPRYPLFLALYKRLEKTSVSGSFVELF
jgi:hypothetical protein